MKHDTRPGKNWLLKAPPLVLGPPKMSSDTGPSPASGKTAQSPPIFLPAVWSLCSHARRGADRFSLDSLKPVWAALLCTFLLLSSLFFPSRALADPGWKMVTAPAVSPQEARKSLEGAARSPLGLGITPGAETEITPEILEQARALKHDPKLIYEFVHNHIHYVPYFGSLKGATLTLLERCGNDFDQTSLFIALMRASDEAPDVRYVFGEITYPLADLANWLGVEQNLGVVKDLLADGGIPHRPSGTNLVVSRVWAKLEGTNHLFDPAFKRYEDKNAKADLKAAMGYSASALLGSAGGELGADSVRNVNEAGLRATLDQYTANLVRALQTNYPNAEMEEIIGGRRIVPEYLDELPTRLSFPATQTQSWVDAPESYVHKIRIQHGGVDREFSIPEIAGKRLAVTYEIGAGASRGILSLPEGTPAEVSISQTPQSPKKLYSATVSPELVASGQGQRSVMSAEPQGNAVWDFGRIAPNGSCQISTVIENNQVQTMDLTASLIENQSNAFSFVEGGGTYELPWREQLKITLRFSGAGQAPGQKTAKLQIRYRLLTTTFDLFYDLQGSVANAPNLQGSYGLYLGQCYQGSPREGTCKIVNAGPLPLQVTSQMRLTGAGAGRFQILSGNGIGTIGAGQSREVRVRYLADQLGSHQADLYLEFTYDGFPYQGGVVRVTGETLNRPEIKVWLEDEIVTSGGVSLSGPGGSETLTLTVDHPYSAYSQNYADDVTSYKLKPGATYVIVSGFGGSRAGLLLKKRQRKLDEYRSSGLGDRSREVLCETLNVMGQTWMKQTTLNDDLLSSLADVVSVRHHRFGVVAQEAGYYIDVKTQVGFSVSRHGDDLAKDAFFKAGSFLQSALEHGVLEQLQVGRPAASTVKLFQIANSQSLSFYVVSSSNVARIDVLSGYGDSEDVKALKALVEKGATLILPSSGKLGLEEWVGKAYVKFGFEDSNGWPSLVMGMIIDGGYELHGGYGGTEEVVETEDVRRDYTPELTEKAEAYRPESPEPVDMVTGAYVLNRTDLSLGTGEPKGLRFARSYSSDNGFKKTVLSYGWRHNYDVEATVHSDGDSGLGLREPVDAAALLVASTVMLDLMTGVPDIKDWVTSALVAKWAMDHLTRNGVSIHLNSEVLTYIRLPDGTYDPPPGVTTKLIREGETFRLEGRFGTRIVFNAQNRIGTWEDVDGNILTFQYNGDRLQRVEDAFGRNLTFEYAGDFLRGVKDSSGRSVFYDHDGAGNLTGYTDPGGKRWSYGYDGKHRMTWLKNPLDVTLATNSYDALGRMKTQTVPRQSDTASYQFRFSGFRSVEEDPLGHERVYHFDEKQRTVGEEDALGNKVTRKYDGQNHLIESTDPRGNTTLFYYDGQHNLLRVSNALGEETRYTYDGEHRLRETRDPLNHATAFQYDPEHHLVKASRDAGNGRVISTQREYLENGLTRATVDGRGTRREITYDRYGHPQEVQVGGEPPVRSFYDPIGQMQSLMDQAGSTTTFIYDPRGLLHYRMDPFDRTSIYSYYDDGRLHTRQDRNGDLLTYTYTPGGKVESITDPDSSRVEFRYDLRDNLVEMEDSIGITVNAYDGANRLIRTTNPHGFVISYEYDEGGNLTKLTYPGGKALLYAYDELNRLKTVTNWLGEKAHYLYDEAGRLSVLENFNGILAYYFYDDADRLIYVGTWSDRGLICSYQFSLDENGNRTEVSQEEPLSFSPDGVAREYTYTDKGNRLQSAGSEDWEFDPEGRVSRRGKRSYEFDSHHRLVREEGYFYEREDFTTFTEVDVPEDRVKVTPSVIFVHEPDFQEVVTVSKDYGLNHFRGDFEHRFDFQQTSPYRPYAMTYIWQMMNPGWANALILYAEDTSLYGQGLHIKLRINGPHWQSNDARNYNIRLPELNGKYYFTVRRTGLRFTCDIYGDAERTELLGSLAMEEIEERAYQFLYMVENNTVNYIHNFDTMRCEIANLVVGTKRRFEYTYDGAGNRLEAVRDGVRTRYIYDAAGNLLAEADEKNTIQRYYIYGVGLLGMVTEPAGDLYCYHFDANANTVAMTDQSQAVVNRYAYMPFGIIGAEEEAVPQPFKFVGQYGVMAEPSGLYYMRARYYDPTTGRFISEDPVGFDGGDVNLYVYAGNNPVMFVDPSGEVINLIGFGIGVISGGITGFATGAKSGHIWAGIAGGIIGAAVGGGVGLILPQASSYISAAFVGAISGAIGGGTGGGAATAFSGGDFGDIAWSAGKGALGGGLSGAVGGAAGQLAKVGMAGAGMANIWGSQFGEAWVAGTVSRSVELTYMAVSGK